MEWRLVVAVLCLIAFTEPTATENVTIAANTTSINATNINITTSAPSAATVTATNTTANNNQTANTNQAASTNQTANTNQAANTSQTTTAAATTASTPAKLATINVVFRIIQEFKDSYTNLSDPETIKLTENITNAFTPIYRRRFTNFRRMFIRKFSKGSIVADSVFEFDNTNNTSPNATEVTNVFTDAIKTGNVSLPVDAASINATDITPSETTTANTSTTTQAATTTVSIEGFNLTFKMTGDFTNDLSNMSSSVATNLTNTVIVELDKVFKKFANHRRTFVRQFRSGSIAVDAGLEFNKALNSTSPTAATLAKALADGVRSGVVALPIDTKTIQVTDSTGTTANKSPVLASMLTAFWMTLASLLLSAVMH